MDKNILKTVGLMTGLFVLGITQQFITKELEKDISLTEIFNNGVNKIGEIKNNMIE